MHTCLRGIDDEVGGRLVMQRSITLLGLLLTGYRITVNLCSKYVSGEVPGMIIGEDDQRYI